MAHKVISSPRPSPEPHCAAPGHSFKLGPMNAAIPEARVVNYPYQEGKAIQKVRYTHDGMIDLIVENPAISQGELAATFGYTPGWVSLVMSSDAFKERLEERRAELVDPAIRATIEERFKAMTTRSLEVLQEKLAQDAHQIPDNLVLKALELGAKGLGIGGNAPPPAPRDGGNRLEALAERLLALQSRVQGGMTYEGQAAEIKDVTPVPQGA